MPGESEHCWPGHLRSGIRTIDPRLTDYDNESRPKPLGSIDR
jgi:hypothetical protein